MIVVLKDGTVGKVVHCVDDFVAVLLQDENGNKIRAEGQVVEILEDE